MLMLQIETDGKTIRRWGAPLDAAIFAAASDAMRADSRTIEVTSQVALKRK